MILHLRHEGDVPALFRQLLTFHRGGEMELHDLADEGKLSSSPWNYGPRITFSVDRATHDRLTAQAQSYGVTLSSLVRRMVVHRLTDTAPLAELPPVRLPEHIGASPRELLVEACSAAGISVAEAKGPGRTRETSERRWHVMAILSDAGWSSCRIGNVLGGRDHATVLHGLKQWRRLEAESAA